MTSVVPPPVAPAAAPAPVAPPREVPLPAPAPPSDGRVEVRGRVLDEDGRPVPGAAVTRVAYEGEDWKETGDTAKSGEDGRLVLRVPPGGWILVNVRHPEFVFARAHVRAGAADEFEVVLRRGPRLTVIVRRPDGLPAEGAAVKATLESAKGVAGIWSWQDVETFADTKTRADGRAVLGAAPEGSVAIVVDHPDYAPARVELTLRGRDPVEKEVTLTAGGTVLGRVLDPDGKPVAGARVHVEGDRARAAVSGEDGTFALASLGEGRATIVAEAEGFGPGYFGERLGWGEPVPVSITAGRTVEGIEIVLGRATWIRGRVLDEAGAPLAGVIVWGGAWPSYGSPEAAKTDAEGRFRLGPWSLKREGNASAWFQSETHRVPEVQNQRVQPGADLDLGDIRAEPLGTVRGVVRDGEGRPVGAGEVSDGGRAAAEVFPDGTFELRGVPPGRAALVARVPGDPPRVSPEVAVEVRAGEPLEGVELRVGPSLSIRGVVRTKAGEPRGGVFVGAIRTGGAAGDDASAEATTPADGTFVLAGLSPGTYRVGVLPTQGRVFVSGEFLAGTEPVTAEAGATGVVLVADAKGGVVKGSAASGIDGKPLRKFRVSLIHYAGFIPDDLDTHEPENAEGTFRVEVEKPGVYAVEVGADGYAPHRTNPSSLGEGQVLDLGVVKLGEGGTIRGTVRDAGGDPVAYARINVLSPKLETNEQEPFTDLDGKFEVKGISPGTYSVFAVSPRHPLSPVRGVVVEEGKAAVADVVYPPNAPLTVTVVDAEGKPIPGVDLAYTFDAVKPLNSRMFRDKEPPGFGVHVTDARGVLVKPCLPPGDVTLFFSAKGWQPKTEGVTLEAGKPNALQVVLERK